MTTYSIPILLGTTRKDNQSSQVANYLYTKLSKIENIQTTLLDLGESDFPLLTERVTDENPITDMLNQWTSTLQNANGIIIVSPEYKSGYPGSLKNLLDYLPAGVFRYKPIGICTVSEGVYAGTSCLQQLRQVIIGMAGLVIPDRFQVGNVQNAFISLNEPESEIQAKTADKFIMELVKYTQNLTRMQNT